MIQNKFKKVFLASFLGVFSLFIAANSVKGSPQEKQASFSLGFKLSGGAGFALNGGGDLEKVRKAYEEWYADIGKEDYKTTTFNWKRMKFIPNFEGELMLIFGKYIGIGIGSGYVTSTIKGDFQEVSNETKTEIGYIYSYDGNYNYNQRYTVHAIPIKISAYFFMPMSSINFYGYAGAGYYLGKLKFNKDSDEYALIQMDFPINPDIKTEITLTHTYAEEAKCNSLGFHAGIGLGINLFRNISFGIEFYGRLLNFTNWKADLTDIVTRRTRQWDELGGWYSDVTINEENKESGIIYYYEHYNSYFGKNYSFIWMYKDKPSIPEYSNVRKAKINLNALGITASIIFRFDL